MKKGASKESCTVVHFCTIMNLFSGVDLALGLGAHQIIDALTMLFQFLFQEIVFYFEIVFVFFEEWKPKIKFSQ